MRSHDVAIIGGGCVGLAVAKHLLERTDRSIAVLEKEHHLAQHQSGRNSGVPSSGVQLSGEFEEGVVRNRGNATDESVMCRPGDPV